MKALVFHGPRDIRYDNFDDPVIRDDRNAIIRVSHSSICGSDLHMYHGGRIGSTIYSPPLVPFCTGHESIGEIVEIGKSVRTHRVGDQVLVAGGVGCGDCRPCMSGRLNHCPRMTAYGIGPKLNGGHAEYLEVVNADLGANQIPEGVSAEQAILLTDALSTGYYGARAARVAFGSTVAVIGQGPVGRMAAECATAMGASHVFAVDPIVNRRNAAHGFGAVPVDPSQARDHIRELTAGRGVDAVVEAVGRGETVALAADLIGRGGHIAVMGIIQGDTGAALQLAQMKSASIHPAVASVVDTWPELTAMLRSDRLKCDGVFTHHFSLSQGPLAYRMFDAQEDDVFKVMLTR